jgi:hypothetical protein
MLERADEGYPPLDAGLGGRSEVGQTPPAGNWPESQIWRWQISSLGLTQDRHSDSKLRVHHSNPECEPHGKRNGTGTPKKTTLFNMGSIRARPDQAMTIGVHGDQGHLLSE